MRSPDLIAELVQFVHLSNEIGSFFCEGFKSLLKINHFRPHSLNCGRSICRVAALAAVVVVGFFAVVPAKKDASPTLALSTHGQTSSIERMLADAKWGGSGAGSFEALLPIYRDSEVDSLEIPTAAATIAIEMGQPFLWACVIVFLMGASILFRRALLRGRDHVYSSAGAACIIALLISLFANDGILGLTASLMISVTCGLAFAQSKSAGNREDPAGELYSMPTRRNDTAAAEVSR